MINRALLGTAKALLIKHEGYRPQLYKDSLGIQTIGVGWNIDANPMRDDEIQLRLANDIQYFYGELSKLDWFFNLDDVRQIAILDMAFMGIKRLLGFEKMIAALTVHDYETASKEVLQSDWAIQVGRRSADIAQILINGTL
jgi:lysozyme